MGAGVDKQGEDMSGDKSYQPVEYGRAVCRSGARRVAGGHLRALW